MKPFKLGPIQKKWIASLKAHPERQTTDFLGYKPNPEISNDYKACCLGEGGLIAKVCKFNTDNDLVTIHPKKLKRSDTSLPYVYKKLGLRGANGEAKDSKNIEYSPMPPLSTLNDAGLTWPEIGVILEVFPEQYFTHSV